MVVSSSWPRPVTTGRGQAARARASCSLSNTARSSRLPPPRASTMASRPSSVAAAITCCRRRQICSSTGPCTGIGTTWMRAEGQRSWAVRSMSARAELGLLVSRATAAGMAGRGRLRSEAKRPSGSSSWRTCSKRSSTVLRLGRRSSTCTQRLARVAQKLSLPTTTTPSPSWGWWLSLFSCDAHTTAPMEASPSTRVSHRWPFLSCGRDTVASSRNRGAKPRSSNEPIARFSSATL